MLKQLSYDLCVSYPVGAFSYSAYGSFAALVKTQIFPVIYSCMPQTPLVSILNLSENRILSEEVTPFHTFLHGWRKKDMRIEYVHMPESFEYLWN